MVGMKIKGRLVFSFVGLLAIVILGVLPLMLQQVSSTITQAEKRELAGLRQAFDSAIAAQVEGATGMALLVAGIPDVQQAFATGDRERLSKLFLPGFTPLKNRMGVDQFQFHLPPATSFLRLHMPGKFGDDLSRIRQTVVEANTSRQAVAGLEAGVSGLGARGVVPLFNGPSHLGTVEFGMALGRKFVEDFKSRYGADATVLIRDAASGGMKPLAATTDRPFLSDSDWAQAMAGQTIIREGDIDGRPVAALASPLLDYSGKPAAVVELVLGTEDYMAELRSARNKAFGGAALILLIGLSAAWLLARNIAEPLVRISKVTRELAEGRLEIDIPSTERKDEVGAMARAVEVFKRNAIDKERMEREAQSARQRQEEDRASRNMAASEHAQEVKAKVDSVDAATIGIRMTAQKMSERSERSGSLSMEMGEAARITSEHAGIVSEAARQLSLAVDEIAQQISSAGDVTREAVAGVSGTAEKMDELSDVVRSIGDIVHLINDIASQTNLLALNATIEAARAGEAGKGFAVVAGEVKNLANQTARATEDIGGKVAEIQASTRSMSASIQEVVSVIGTLDGISSAIAGAIQQQDASTREIASNVDEVAHQANKVALSVSQMARASAQTCAGTIRVIWSAKDLTQIVDGLTGETEKFILRLNDEAQA
ncbi:Methyl-accepting chemotaxis protein [Magnetospirillum sp. XM-1]|uniref:methyl-accepting chemotaxis protein n=1 Tax=Magnetospirillum sp. XM-1 TaxID=1663591 RepID=UPI00073DD477|nr:methyl-accepting chemotaxis protein [Magnetospirillum sp. XM-1]CUW40698.1 Methyl-accepting chemotaxis protein [Magnetospirillum sp. XM-1]